DSYTEDVNTQVLRRYYMFTLTYTIKNFKKGNFDNIEQPNIPKSLPLPPPSGGGHFHLPPPTF
ncbi:MAG TPA: hypothetical protein P5250_04050, partial [Bacteroidales bacterium]|nr:hypothetical protein [Bacteroidales bacterium]